MIAALLCVVGCDYGETDATQVASRFAAAARYGQGASIWPHLSRASRAVLEAEAERASNQIGDRRNVAPHEMLQIVDVPALDGRRLPTLARDGDARATVTFFGVDGGEYPVQMILEGGAWKVALFERTGAL